MEGTFNLTIEGIDTKIDGMPIKLGKIHISGSGKRSWFDMFVLSRFLKALPKWMPKMYKEITKLEQK